jgi:hypothetical protein
MCVIEYAKLARDYGYYTTTEVVYFAVEDRTGGPIPVTMGTHAEENAVRTIADSVAALRRIPAFICVFSTYSPCKEYTATGSQTQHNCSSLMCGLIRNVRAGEWYFRYRYEWEGDGDAAKKAATRSKSREGLAEMRAAGWKFIV